MSQQLFTEGLKASLFNMLKKGVGEGGNTTLVWLFKSLGYTTTETSTFWGLGSKNMLNKLLMISPKGGLLASHWTEVNLKLFADANRLVNDAAIVRRDFTLKLIEHFFLK